MKINIIWGKYVVYDYGREDISGTLGEKTIDIKNSAGEVVSQLVINTTEKTILTLPALSQNVSYDIEIDDGIVTTASPLPSEQPSTETPTTEIAGVKISELPATSTLQQNDLFAISRDDGSNGSYDRTLHVTLTDLIAAINPLATYTLTVNGVTGGEVNPLNPENYQEGASVTAGITMDPEYNFLSWTSDWPSLDGDTNAQLSFDMPAQDVTLTPNVERVDNSTWTFEMYQIPGDGAGGWDPDTHIFSDGSRKVAGTAGVPNLNASVIFYHNPGLYNASNNGERTYTSVFIMQNEYEWVKDEINASNYDNLIVEYIDDSGSVLKDSSSNDMRYTGEEQLTEAFANTGEPARARIGIKNNISYVAIRFEQIYPGVRARIIHIPTQETVTSKRAIVYSDLDPIFGYSIDPN